MRALAHAFVLSLGLAAAGVAAQNANFTLPTPPVVAGNNNLPFAGGIVRYQQWYSAAEVVTRLNGLTPPLAGPLRFLQCDFLAGSGQQTATTLDLDVRMAHGPSQGLSGSFDFDMPTPLVVVPRAVRNLVTGPTGSVVLPLPFTTQFTWDGVRPVILEVRVYGNGRGSQAFPYDFQAATGSAFGKLTRAYFVGNANAQFATSVQTGWGLFTRFVVRPGAMVPFGAGCPGEGSAVPVNEASSLASPGIVWGHQLSQASSQRLAVWILGDSRTQWGNETLPYELAPVGGVGCFLLTNPVATVFTMTVGGGPGAGTANVSVSLPATTGYIGLSVYSQWLVADPFAPNGVLSASNGVWTVVAPVGG